MLESEWVWQCTKSVSIPAEEQNAGLIVDYFYRMEFHITPRFFSDSNYLFFTMDSPQKKIFPGFPPVFHNFPRFFALFQQNPIKENSDHCPFIRGIFTPYPKIFSPAAPVYLIFSPAYKKNFPQKTVLPSPNLKTPNPRTSPADTITKKIYRSSIFRVSAKGDRGGPRSPPIFSPEKSGFLQGFGGYHGPPPEKNGVLEVVDDPAFGSLCQKKWKKPPPNS